MKVFIRTLNLHKLHKNSQGKPKKAYSFKFLDIGAFECALLMTGGVKYTKYAKGPCFSNNIRPLGNLLENGEP